MLTKDGMQDVSGVGFFSRHPTDGYYLHNPVVGVSDAEKIVVNSLRLRWV
jgi:hypothetical protein